MRTESDIGADISYFGYVLEEAAMGAGHVVSHFLLRRGRKRRVSAICIDIGFKINQNVGFSKQGASEPSRIHLLCPPHDDVQVPLLHHEKHRCADP